MISQRAIIESVETAYPYKLEVMRLDLLDPEISGNKWFKLKFNLDEAKRQGFTRILTFGGAYSNHIAACAAACKRYGIDCIGVIRGTQQAPLNQTLLKAKNDGMQLYFVSRDEYKERRGLAFQNKLKAIFGESYLIPEGGNNIEGLRGCTEILDQNKRYDYVFCACGTGTTYAGLLVSSPRGQCVVGISVLKGENTLVEDVRRMLDSFDPANTIRLSGNDAIDSDILNQHCIINSYAFKGYASFDSEWYNFKTEFEAKNKIPLDYVYTSKMMFAVFDLMKKGKLKANSEILVIHSGGLQGNSGFEQRYHLKPSL